MTGEKLTRLASRPDDGDCDCDADDDHDDDDDDDDNNNNNWPPTNQLSLPMTVPANDDSAATSTQASAFTFDLVLPPYFPSFYQPRHLSILSL